ncbi:organic cation transporter protein-like isoform X2 [Macrosteles quadrilineatus]|nr:organic cation transporter protein-like isoform X2 [Macrosteles quadrilineatus]XP_054263784.1 organic cation transporter protein-like isoform X2 [Macrosteles quadrilineatus]XP_054263785.1 organic cation transporter protein-like isoform X2 [Macrosteles quadrilineatus]XP_054263786.1 organic cation transporter protein-like isoform X2 [Macrosteles quadrilineatus]XP_054263787.1 organic cation transporter protein-like isoform X2 [Macrosteles quadrilineatus]
MPHEAVESLDRALEKVNQRKLWLLSMFLLTSSPGVFNAYHIMASLFLSHIPPHWCQVEELTTANWTSEQIRNISSPGGSTESSCSVIGWNYTQLADMGYEAALEYVKSHTLPPASPCINYSYDEDVPHSSTVTEWDLVCDRLPLKSNVQSSIALGKFVGGFLFGFIADKYGRKSSFVLACLTYVVTGPLAAFAPSYWLFIVARFFIGTAGSGCYESAYTLLTELASKDRRAMLGCVYNMSYPFGYITLSLIALMFPAWRTLQLAVSLPMLLLLFHCWLLPESPRWLMTQGRQIEAWAVVKSIDASVVPPTFENITNIQGEEGPYVPLFKRILDGIRKLFALFGTKELCRRICISYFTWFVAALSYYVLALNADNFSSNRYVYLALAGLVEAPSYVLPLLILMFLGRKSTAALLFLLSGLALISILLIPQENKLLILVVALLGRFADSAVFAVIILHTSELFPTSNRNTAIGTSLAVSQLGSISAPYVVDILGKYVWYMPSTLCGGLALCSVLLTLVLPETRGKPLMDTVQDLKKAHHQDRVSVRNCCTFS